MACSLHLKYKGINPNLFHYIAGVWISSRSYCEKKWYHIKKGKFYRYWL